MHGMKPGNGERRLAAAGDVLGGQYFAGAGSLNIRAGGKIARSDQGFRRVEPVRCPVGPGRTGFGGRLQTVAGARGSAWLR